VHHHGQADRVLLHGVRVHGAEPRQGQAASHLAKSIFAITIGSNDIINYAKADAAGAGTTSPSQQQQFVDGLVQSLAGQLQSLYNLGARKVLFLGLGPVGCCPSLRELSSARDLCCPDTAIRIRIRILRYGDTAIFQKHRYGDTLYIYNKY
jgi:hypothetical protein